MPSIYDLFGNAKGLQGLLTEPEIGSAQGDALLQASLALMAAGGPSDRPVSFGQALAGAYGKGREAFKSGIEGQVGNVLTAQKIAELKRQQDIRAARQKILSGMSGEMSATDALAQGGGPTPENAAKIGMPRQMDANRLNQAIAGLLSIQDVEGAKELNELRKSMFPAFKTQSVQELRIGDTNKKFAVGDDGSLREIGVSPEDLMQVDLGGQKALVGKTTGKVLAQYGVSMTPDAVASNAVARQNAMTSMGNLDVARQRLAFDMNQPKPPTEAAAKQMIAYSSMSKGLDEYEKTIKSGGITSLPTEKKQRLSTQYQDLLLMAKEMYALGVLNGPDLDILQKVLIDPTAVGTNINPMRGEKAVKSNIEEVKKILERSRQSLESTYGRAIPKYQPAQNPVLNSNIGSDSLTQFGMSNIPMDKVNAELARRGM